MKRSLLTLLTLSLFLIGCKTEMKGFQQYVEELQASTNVNSELQSATILNEFAADQRISYSVELIDVETSSPIPMANLEQAINKKLSVSISVSDHDYRAEWKPLDNTNIFVLLRE